MPTSTHYSDGVATEVTTDDYGNPVAPPEPEPQPQPEPEPEDD